MIRTVIDEPGRAASIGARAAADIRDLHSPAVAGVRMREVLAAGDVRWRQAQHENAADPEPVAPTEPIDAPATRGWRGLTGRVRGKVAPTRTGAGTASSQDRDRRGH